MATTNKKIHYNTDFKVKILEYYIRNGGDSKYGLKTKTCALFNINKKTIHRLLENPEIVKRAKKNIGQNVKPRTKGAAGKVVKPGVKTMGNSKPVAKPSKVVVGKSSSAGNNKVSSTVVNSSQGASANNKQKASGLGSSSSNNNTTTNSTTDKTSRQTNFSPQKDDIGKENATLFDILPENPDFSILKRPITSSASSNASSIARLLVTGTNEVQNMLLNECEIIFECKVCRNLFRSIVNFLAHKRIYCRDNYSEVKNIFHKDPQCGLTTQSSTVVVEPEPPPESAAHKETWATSDNLSWRSRNRRRRIDNIADTLARKNEKKVETSPTSASDRGSSQYYQRIGEISSSRDSVTRECSVTLENISGVSNAVYQNYTPPDSDPSPADYEATHSEIRKQQKGQTLEVTKSGKVVPMDVEEVEALEVKKSPAKASPSKQHICGQCNQQFATAKTLGVHQRSVHNNERTIFPCPMCETKFLSMWAAVKHLHRYHHKSKVQRERLRKVIKKRSYKKILTLAEEGAVKKAAEDMEKEQEDAEEEEEDKSTDSDIPNFTAQPDESQNESQEIDVTKNTKQKQQQQQQQRQDDDDDEDDNSKEDNAKISNQKETVKEDHSERGSPFKGCRSKKGVRWMCNVCSKKFLSRSTCWAHVATHITCNFEPLAIEVPAPEEDQLREVQAALKLKEDPPKHKKKTVVSVEQLKPVPEKKIERNVGINPKRKIIDSVEQFKPFPEKKIEGNVGINPKRKIIDSDAKLKYRILDSRGNIKNTEFIKHEYECRNDKDRMEKSKNEKEDKHLHYEKERKEIYGSDKNRLSTSFDSNVQKGMDMKYHEIPVQTSIMMARKVLAKAKQTAAKASVSPRNSLNNREKTKDINQSCILEGKFTDIAKRFTISDGLSRNREITDNSTSGSSEKVETTKCLESITNETKTGSTINIDSLVPNSTSRLKDSKNIIKDSTSRIKDLHFVEQSTSKGGKKFTTLIPVSRSTKMSSDSGKEIDKPESFKEISLNAKASFLSNSGQGVSGKSFSVSPFHDNKPSYSSSPRRDEEKSNFAKESDVKQNDNSLDQALRSSMLEINTLLIKEEDIKDEYAEEGKLEERESISQETVKFEPLESPEPTCTNSLNVESKKMFQTENRYIQYKSNKLIKGPIDEAGSSISLIKGPIDKVGSSISYQSIFRKTKTPVLYKGFHGLSDDELSLSTKRSREDDDTTLTDSTYTSDLESDDNFLPKKTKTKDSISQNIICDSKIESANLSILENEMKGKRSFSKVDDLSNKYANKKSSISNTKVDLELQSQSSSQISIAQNNTNDCHPIRNPIRQSLLFGKLSYDIESDFNECTLSDANADFDSNVSDVSTLDSQIERKTFMKDSTLNETSSEGDSKDQLGDIRYEDEIFGDIPPHDKEEKP